ncbi:MAG: hypothetical protein PWP46_1212 [Fusobacteriaceae bacterium]|jgi:flavodoxin|nr:hypothetical protein [Fusobacteriales bacterium]MDN5304328.1 hypothetical protein [Fusobacteriaceae bacterium]
MEKEKLKISIVYHSKTSNTKEIAELIKKGAEGKGVKVKSWKYQK